MFHASVRWIHLYILTAILTLTRAKWWSNDPLSVHTMRNDQVQIMQLYEGRNKLRLRCDAKGTNASDSLVLLACPSVKNGFCRENCMSPCLIFEGSLDCSNQTQTPIHYCRYRVMSADHVRVDYKVELNDEQDAGKWWCMFRGQSSDPIELQYQPAEKKTVALPQLNPETTKTPGSHNTTHVVPLNGNGSAVKLVVKNATHETQSSIVDTDLLFVTNMPLEILIIIILFVCISVIFNVAFVIRCCMVNSYLKKLHKGQPRSHWYDQLLCMEKSKALTNRSRLDYIRIPEHKLSPVTFQSSPVMGTMRPSSTLFLSNSFPTPQTPLYPTSINSPVLVRNVTTSTGQYETQPGMELIYDDVNHSTTYTTVTPGSKTQLTNPLLPMVNTPDGRTWILDRTGRVYLPCAQSSFPVGYESSQTQIAPPALPYESSTRNLNCVPEYEQEEAFRNTTTNIPIFPSKRCATPLPSRPSHSRADSTPHLAYSGTRAASIKDLSRVPPRFATQTTIISPLAVPYTQSRPGALPNPVMNPEYPQIHPLSLPITSGATSRVSPTNLNLPDMDCAPSSPLINSTSSLVASPVFSSTSELTAPISSTENQSVNQWVSTQAQRLLKSDPKAYFEEWALSE